MGYRHVLSAIIALGLSSSALCQTYKIAALSAGGPPKGNIPAGQLELIISLTPKGSAQSITPPLGDVTSATLWQVKVFQKNLMPPIVVTNVTPSPDSDYARTGILRLTTSAGYSLDAYQKYVQRVDVTFLGGGGAATSSMPDSPSSPSPQVSKTGGNTAGCNSGASFQGQPGASYFNYCLSGIWVPQVGSHPLYSTNSNFSVAHKWGPGSIGVRGQEAADSSVVLDPNTFSSATFFDAVLVPSTKIPGLMGIIGHWNIATVEFDRKKKNSNLGTNVNLITAPEAIFPFDLGHGVGMEIDTGIEAGHNYKNNINPNGFGAVFRGLLGAQAGKIFTPKKTIKSIKWTSQYQARLLADDEVITKSVHGKLIPYKGHQTRNWVSTELDFMFTSNFGITLKHDYGALPPGYVFVENRASVGFTVQTKQK